MTAIFYPDCEAASPGGRFTLEARSPHNGTIPRRDGSRPSREDFAFRYREHQSEFRYRLLDNTPRHPLRRLLGGPTRRVVWERWQGRDEDSPHELVVSDDGWSVVRTHGFRSEVVAVSPAGRDAVRVRITGPGGEHRGPASPGTPVFSWSPEHLVFSTAGLYWTGHSWRYFLSHGGSPFFVWRTSWGQRLVLDLGRGALLRESPQLPPEVEQALAREERRGVSALLAGLSGRMGEVRTLLSRREEDGGPEHPLAGQLPLVTAALHLAGVYRLRECVPFLRGWEAIDCPSLSMGSVAMGDDWWLETQSFRPVAHHALRLMGEEPLGFATYHFRLGDDTRRRFPVPERLPDRRARAGRLGRGMSAGQVLRLLGSPDFVKRRGEESGGPPYRWTEVWEYDFRSPGGWETLQITWEEGEQRGRIRGIEEVAPYWLRTDEREAEFLRP